MGILEAARRGAAYKAMESPGAFAPGTLFQGYRSFLPGTAIDYEAEAGNLWVNGVVMPGLVWKANASAEPQLAIQQFSDAEGKYLPITGKSPSAKDLGAALSGNGDEEDSMSLWSGLCMSEDIRGSGYWFKNQDRLGRWSFEWVSPTQLRPVHDPRYKTKPNQRTTNYLYRPIGGGEEVVPLEKVIRSRGVLRDPDDPLEYLAPLRSVLREICTDNEFATMMAALARNMGIPGLLMTPKVDAPPPNDSQKKALREWLDKFRRDRRGSSDVLPSAVELLKPGFTPREMQASEQRMDPTMRICVALGLDMMVLGFESKNKTYSNYEQAADSAGKRTLIPMLRRWSDQVGRQVLPLFGFDPRSYRLWWDFSDVHWLLDDVALKHEIWREDYRAGLIDRATALACLGLPYTPKDVGVYYSTSTELPADPKAAKAYIQGLKSRVAQ